MPLFPAKSKVTVTSGTHAGKKGRVRAHADLFPKSGDVMHIVDLGHFEDGEWVPDPLFVPNQTPNPVNQFGQKVHGEAGPQPAIMQVDWIEVPGSELTAST